ncbi:spore germination protein [Oceanobacillus sp. 143]|uniref:Spore germination protein n=1 Tax=Oceanobacillus zhaokaii TaxID=2052660 RepID=A0A345PF85_9BACI|nr:spore germination protein [Oceanobacillus zhaokaii]AXI08665.1 spore germination protein [Oceanobacillus zhaokaii]QGS68430.1 spore germination protein [Oceanobacillus sp. 143]
MRKRFRTNKQSDSIFPIAIDELEQLLQDNFPNNPDLVFSKYHHHGKKIAVFYISYMVEIDKVENYLLEPLLSMEMDWTTQTLLNEIPVSSGKTTVYLDDVLNGILLGKVFVYIEQEKEIIEYILSNKEKRSLEKAETESLVLGPKVAFTESLITNLNIIRWRIRSTDLVLEEIKVGKKIPREVRLIYMKSVANETDVNTMRQRLLDLDVDDIEDSVVLSQYIEDSSSNLFPQLDSTELPDRFTYSITKGKVGLLVENSPSGIVAPATLFSFLESTEDLYMKWQAGSFLRLVRFLAMFFSIIVTPGYVAVITYHYEVMPMQLLLSVGESRASVPFPPLLEALLIEFMIELLREAGARLPTKVGQTMGIVGGIVIGQAAVQAGITSNILIIVVAMSALASFTSPSYLLGTTIRLIRFPLIFLSGILGFIGLIFGICLLIIHLLRLTSLGTPYLAPLYPLSLQDFNKVFYRLPFNMDNKRAKFNRPKDIVRYSAKEAKRKRDIDE